MDIRQGGALVAAIPLAFLIASIVTWAACRWWYGKKLVAAGHRLQKSDKARLFSHEQTQQAKRQIEQLKSELASHQRLAAESQAAHRRAAQLNETLQASERAAVPDSGRLPVVSAHGFADTQVLPD
jgi:biopolymer transport protein ExbB/TolQ